MDFWKFQSLFLWKWFWKSFKMIYNLTVNEFQSLFLWKWFWKNNLLPTAATHNFFVSILVFMEVVLKDKKMDRKRVWGSLVSILVFMEVVLKVSSWIVNYHIPSFQSLFLWKWFWKLAYNIFVARSPLSFNPCFYGSGSERIYEVKTFK